MLPKKFINISFSGLGVAHGAKDNLTRAERLNVKSSRYLDVLMKRESKKPGACHYKDDMLDKGKKMLAVPPR